MERLIPCGKIKTKSAADIHHTRLGIGFEKLDRKAFQPEKAYDKIAALGIHWVRIQSGWARCEKEKGVYDFAWLDEIVNSLRARSMKPWINLSYGNGLYTECAVTSFGGVGCPPLNSEEAMTAWLDYVDALVRHFEGRVSYYEIWNEPDLGYSWKHDGEETPRPDASEYGDFYLATAKTIHNASQTAKVMGFGVANLTRHLDFIAEALEKDLLPHLDAISFHSYTTDDFNRCRRIEDLRSLCRAKGKDVEIIQGETGAQSRSDGSGAMHHFSWTPEKQYKHQLRHMICDFAADVTFSSYFTTVDMMEALRGKVGDKSSYLDFGYFGVLGADFDEDGVATGNYTPKPSYYTLQNLAAIFAEDWTPAQLPISRQVLPSRRVNGEDCNDITYMGHGFRRPDGTAAYAYWNAVPLLTQAYEGTVSFFVATKEKIRLIDPISGKVYAIPESMTEEKIGGTLLKNLPITDTPPRPHPRQFCRNRIRWI